MICKEKARCKMRWGKCHCKDNLDLEIQTEIFKAKSKF